METQGVFQFRNQYRIYCYEQCIGSLLLVVTIYFDYFKRVVFYIGGLLLLQCRYTYFIILCYINMEILSY